MIDQADGRVKEWAAAVDAGAAVSLAPPTDGLPGRGVSLYLMELASEPPARGGGRPPLQLGLRYLVTTWAEAPEEAHRLLGQLAFAAMEEVEFQVELEPVPAAAWAALGAAPRPSFVLRVPLRQERPVPTAKPVRQPLVVQPATLAGLHGLVLGPGDAPLVDVRVELPAFGLRSRTDIAGRFGFPGVPEEPRAKQLRLTAKGRALSVTAAGPTTAEAPLVIRFDPPEE